MKVNIAVCGRFHYHNYVRYLDEAGCLNRFYYSHRIATNGASLGLSSGHGVNLWLKEYLIRLHGRLTRDWLIPQAAPVYAGLWQTGVLRRWSHCDIFHVMLHGTALEIIRRAQRDGSRVIVEAVNQHPSSANDILSEEAHRFGLRHKPKLSRISERQVEEAANSDFLLAPSRIVRDSFVTRGYERRKTAVIPYGIDLKRFRARDSGSGETSRRGDSRFRVICVAQISPRKGQVYLLEAWKQLRLENAELVLIGAVSYEMTTILRSYDNTFHHIPSVPNHQLFEYYARSSVFVLPTLEDGFGITCVEAMACGLPVVTTVNAGASEIIDDGEDGFVVPIRSPEAIAERLEMLYKDEDLRQEMADAALAKARRDLSWEKYALRLVKLYRFIFQHRSDPSIDLDLASYMDVNDMSL